VKSAAHSQQAATKLVGNRGLTDQIYEAIRTKIMMWELVSGDFLVEARLAEEYGVSRTPVRESLGLLARDGLVEAFPRIGYQVTPIGLQDVHEIFDMRILLEGEAAARVAVSATAAELEALGKKHEAWADSILGIGVSKREYLRFHDEFHLGIAELSKSMRLACCIKRLLFEGTRLRMADPLMSKEGLEGEQRDSRALLDALLSHESRLAKEIVRDHIAKSKRRSLARLVENGRGVVVSAMSLEGKPTSSKGGM